MFLKSGNTIKSFTKNQVSKLNSNMKVVVIVFDGFGRLQKLIKNLPVEENISYFLAGRISPLNSKKLTELIMKKKGLVLMDTQPSEYVEPSAIYHLPDRQMISVCKGKFVFRKPSVKNISNSFMEQMLNDLAVSLKENLTVVYLSEKRTDGYSVIPKILKSNGHILVQLPVSKELKLMSKEYLENGIVQSEISSIKLGLKISNLISSTSLRSGKVAEKKELTKKAKKKRINEDLGFKVLIDHASIAFFITKPDGTILEANQAACDLFGYTENEFIRIGRQGIFDSSSMNIEQVLSERDKNGFVKAKLIGIKKSDERLLLDVSSKVFLNSNNEKISITSVVDVSKQHQAEQEMKWLINSSDESFVLLDLDLTIVSFNNKFCFLYKELFGKGVKKGKSVFEYTQPERLELVREIYKRVLKGSIERDTINVKLPDGKIRMFNLKYSPARNDKDKIIGVFVSSLDVTEENELKLKQLELLKELESRNLFIETILQNIPIGVAVNKVDDGKATLVNARFHQTYGWDENDFSGTNEFLKKVYPDELYRNEIMKRVLSDIQSKDPARMNWENIEVTTKSGEKRIINAKNIPLFEQNLMISTVGLHW